jgi:hypothetical protein
MFQPIRDRFSDEAWEARFEQILRLWGTGELTKTHRSQ